MMGHGFAARALAPSIIALVLACIGIGVGVTLAFGWGIPWLWEHVSITVK